MNNSTRVGIDDMALHVPRLYLPIQTLAEKRNIEYAKLSKGLGLEKMAIPDVHEDAATMAASAVAELIEKNHLDPNTIGRIYLGTESALDGAKPTATYVVNMLQQKLEDRYGAACFRNCDVVDLTFACVGGVDALQNTLDWVKGDEGRIGIVVTSDFAKYELASTGEYTQGAGAVAMLVKHNPRLLAIRDTFGVGMHSEHDFYKPQRAFTKKQIVEEVLRLANIQVDAQMVLDRLNGSLAINGFIDDNDETLLLHKDTPIFDGPFSNLTYQNRIREAYQHFLAQAETEESLLDRWARLIFHLPYAFHGKRIFMEIFMLEKQRNDTWDAFAKAHELVAPKAVDFEDDATYQKAYAKFLKAISKTDEYRALVSEKLEKAQRASSEIGNMYACSIFLALMSTFEADWQEDSKLVGKQFGFFGYGSGSKSKVFEAVVQPQWKEVVANFQLTQKLNNRQALDYPTYEKLHRKRLSESVAAPQDELALASIGTEGVTLGARYYKFVPAKVEV